MSRFSLCGYGETSLEFEEVLYDSLVPSSSEL